MDSACFRHADGKSTGTCDRTAAITSDLPTFGTSSSGVFYFVWPCRGRAACRRLRRSGMELYQNGPVFELPRRCLHSPTVLGECLALSYHCYVVIAARMHIVRVCTALFLCSILRYAYYVFHASFYGYFVHCSCVAHASCACVLILYLRCMRISRGYCLAVCSSTYMCSCSFLPFVRLSDPLISSVLLYLHECGTLSHIPCDSLVA